MRKYSILGKKVSLVGYVPESVLDVLDRFEGTWCGNPDVEFVVEPISTVVYGVGYFGRDFLRNITGLYFSTKDTSYFSYSLDSEYRKNIIHVGNVDNFDAFMEVFMVGFYSFVSLGGFVLLHASVVERDGLCVVFTGDSGVGKTTQAELWSGYCGYSILNGDKVFLSVEDGRVVAWGSPWKGSSKYYENSRGVVSCVISLQQGTENKYLELDEVHSLEVMMSHSFIPKWCSRCESTVYDTIGGVLGVTRFGSFVCLPDRSAVDCLKRYGIEEVI